MVFEDKWTRPQGFQNYRMLNIDKKKKIISRTSNMADQQGDVPLKKAVGTMNGLITSTEIENVILKLPKKQKSMSKGLYSLIQSNI